MSKVVDINEYRTSEKNKEVRELHHQRGRMAQMKAYLKSIGKKSGEMTRAELERFKRERPDNPNENPWLE